MFHVTVTYSIVVCRVKTSATHQIVYYFSMEKVAKQTKESKFSKRKAQLGAQEQKTHFNDYLNFLKRLIRVSKEYSQFYSCKFQTKNKKWFLSTNLFFNVFALGFPIVPLVFYLAAKQNKREKKKADAWMQMPNQLNEIAQLVAHRHNA